MVGGTQEECTWEIARGFPIYADKSLRDFLCNVFRHCGNRAMNPATPKNDLNEWNDLVMPSFARPLLLPCPTLCAINGHAFGAGLMYALGTDYRMQRAERGYLCAPEVAIGVFTPSPELSLFRHAIPAHAFYETVLHAKRWDAADAVANGVVHAAVPGAELAEEAFKVAAQLAQLAKNRNV